jgi:hypothetical protein
VIKIKVVGKPDEAPAGTRWIKSGGFAVYTFIDLDEAKKIFPDLGANHQGKHFTGAFRKRTAFDLNPERHTTTSACSNTSPALSD